MGDKLELRNLLLQQDRLLLGIKAKRYHFHNKPGALLARKVKSLYVRSKIAQLVDPDTKSSVVNPQDIAKAFGALYEKLYNLHADPRRLSPLFFLESVQLPISPAEIVDTISSLPLHKSLGIDGFTNANYKKFQDLLSPHLAVLFNASASLGSFTEDMLRAIVITILKPGKHLTLLESYRPISLLNSDVKIYAKTLARRLLQVLPRIVHPDQVGFIHGRQAPDATILVLDLLDSSVICQTPSLFLSLDAEKRRLTGCTGVICGGPG